MTLSPLSALPRDGGDVRGGSLDSLVAANRAAFNVVLQSQVEQPYDENLVRAYLDFFVECGPVATSAQPRGQGDAGV